MPRLSGYRSYRANWIWVIYRWFRLPNSEPRSASSCVRRMGTVKLSPILVPELQTILAFREMELASIIRISAWRTSLWILRLASMQAPCAPRSMVTAPNVWFSNWTSHAICLLNLRPDFRLSEYRLFPIKPKSGVPQADSVLASSLVFVLTVRKEKNSRTQCNAPSSCRSQI